MERKCYNCKETKPIEEFYKDSSHSTGRKRICKKCNNKKSSRINKKGAEHFIPETTYNEMLIHQGGVCRICQKPSDKKRLAVDHDHRTKEIRGLLCASCNLGLGYFRDDPILLAKAIAYLS